MDEEEPSLPSEATFECTLAKVRESETEAQASDPPVYGSCPSSAAVAWVRVMMCFDAARDKIRSLKQEPKTGAQVSDAPLSMEAASRVAVARARVTTCLNAAKDKLWASKAGGQASDVPRLRKPPLRAQWPE